MVAIVADAGAGKELVVAVINAGVVKKKKERTHLMNIDTLDRETNRLHCREELGVLVVMATSSSLTAAEVVVPSAKAGAGASSSSLTAGGGGLVAVVAVGCR